MAAEDHGHGADTGSPPPLSHTLNVEREAIPPEDARLLAEVGRAIGADRPPEGLLTRFVG